jgi:hypothetical protein
MFARNIHSSLLQTFVNYDSKKFYNIGPRSLEPNPRNKLYQAWSQRVPHLIPRREFNWEAQIREFSLWTNRASALTTPLLLWQRGHISQDYCLGFLPLYILGSAKPDQMNHWSLYQSIIWCQIFLPVLQISRVSLIVFQAGTALPQVSIFELVERLQKLQVSPFTSW